MAYNEEDLWYLELQKPNKLPCFRSTFQFYAITFGSSVINLMRGLYQIPLTLMLREKFTPKISILVNVIILIKFVEFSFLLSNALNNIQFYIISSVLWEVNWSEFQHVWMVHAGAAFTKTTLIMMVVIYIFLFSLPIYVTAIWIRVRQVGLKPSLSFVKKYPIMFVLSTLIHLAIYEREPHLVAKETIPPKRTNRKLWRWHSDPNMSKKKIEEVLEDYEKWKKMRRTRSRSLDSEMAFKSASLSWNFAVNQIIKGGLSNNMSANSEINMLVQDLVQERSSQRVRFSAFTPGHVSPPTACSEKVSNSIVFNRKDTIVLLKCLALNSIMFHLKSLWLAYTFFFGYVGPPYLGIFYYLSFKGFMLQSFIYCSQIYAYLHLVR